MFYRRRNMKIIRKLLSVALAITLAISVISVLNVQEVQAATLAKTKTVYKDATATLKLNTKSEWKNVKTEWSKKKGTGNVTLSSEKNKSVKVTGTKVGTATVTAKVTYKKSGKEYTKTFTTTVTVKEPGSAPKLKSVVKNGDLEALCIDLEFDKKLDDSSFPWFNQTKMKKALAKNFEITIGDKTFSSYNDYKNAAFESYIEGKYLYLTIWSYSTDDLIADYNADITVTVKDTATILGTNGKKISATSSAVTAKKGTLYTYDD
jgi:hypothetical protein